MTCSRLSTCVGIEDAIRNAHLIIETAADELETELELFTIFDKFARPDAIFVTTSDAHAIAEIADITVCPERCVTLRFTPSDNPIRVALIPGRQTSAHALARCSEFAQRLNSKPPWRHQAVPKNKIQRENVCARGFCREGRN